MLAIRALTLCVLVLASGVAAAGERAVPYADMHKIFSRIATVDGARFVKLRPTLSAADGSMAPSDIRMTIKSRAGDIVVPVDEKGRASFPVRADLEQENPDVMVNVAQGQLNLNIGMDIDAPPEQRFRYGLMQQMQDEIDELMKEQGMMARMFAPDFDALVVEFPPGTAATAVVESSEGAESFTADAQGRIALEDRRAWRREDPWVQLSAKPTRITLRQED